MNRFKHYFNIFCIAFTINVAILMALSFILNFTPIDSFLIGQLLILQTVIAVALFLVDSFINFSTPLYIITTFSMICLIVLFFGIVVFGFIALDFANIIIVVLMTVAIYTVVYLMLYFKNKADADKINKIVKEKNFE